MYLPDFSNCSEALFSSRLFASGPAAGLSTFKGETGAFMLVLEEGRVWIGGFLRRSFIVSYLTLSSSEVSSDSEAEREDVSEFEEVSIGDSGATSSKQNYLLTEVSIADRGTSHHQSLNNNKKL